MFSQSELEITNSVFDTCTSKSGNGGAVVADHASTPVIRGCVFQNNTAAANGGALFASSKTLVVEGSTFTNNRGDVNGGAIMSTQTSVTLSKNEFFENQAANGGAIYQCVYITRHNAINFSLN